MQTTDFQAGVSYSAIRKDFAPPDGSAVVAGKAISFTVLPPADASNKLVFDGFTQSTPSATEVASWKAFLRVQNHASGKVHLLHPETIASAQPIAPDPH